VPNEIQTLIILGAGGDLAQRLLLPGLASLIANTRGEPVLLIGVDAVAISDDEWRAKVTSSFAASGSSGTRVDEVVAASRHAQVDVTDPSALRALLATVTGTPALYFALPPAVTILACDALRQVELPPGTLLCLEKPFGTNLQTSRALNRQLEALVPENQIHRIDHFLGKSTVLNLLGVRFANRIFENVWSNEHIASVDIVFDEPLALEGRAGYYDRAGALVDMIQSHLLLVLGVATMEPPSSIDPDDLRGAVAQALRATHVWNDDPVGFTRRARYGAGTINGRQLPAYVDEQGVNPSLNTETLAEITLAVDNWRWAGVPFRLRSGKALSASRKEILVTFKDVPHRPTGLTGDPGPARLRIALDPDGIQLDLNINAEGDPFGIDRVKLSADFAASSLPAYGEVLSGILRSDPTLAVRADAIEECWRIVTPVLNAWSHDRVPLDVYPAGTTGPADWTL
jgi:glucose-6-phosphate 1-dehydrogenase